MTKDRFSDAALLVVDVQQGFDDAVWGTRNNPNLEANVFRIIQHWRSLGRAVLPAQHCSVEPDSPLRPERLGCRFKEQALPLDGEAIYRKTVNSAFIGTSLEEDLKNKNIQRLVVVGMTTNHCVSTTVRMAGNLGFETYVVSDATATFNRIGPDGTEYSADQIHDVSLASLHGEFATVVDTNFVVAS